MAERKGGEVKLIVCGGCGRLKSEKGGGGHLTWRAER